MTSVGIMASAVVTAACTAVLSEPFNNLSAAPWTAVGVNTSVAGRTATAWRVTGLTGGNYLMFTIPGAAESDTIMAGFAFQTTSLAAVPNICEFRSDAGATNHDRLIVNTNGSVAIQRGTSTTLATSAAGLIVVNTWNYVEMQIRLHDSAGTLTVRLNNSIVIGPLAALDTKNSGTKATFDALRLVGPTSSQSNTFDDLYLSTGSGCSFQGSITIP